MLERSCLCCSANHGKLERGGCTNMVAADNALAVINVVMRVTVREMAFGCSQGDTPNASAIA